jgi:hypothetical protein
LKLPLVAASPEFGVMRAEGPLHLYDGLHLNDVGSAMVAKIVAKALRPVLKSLKTDAAGLSNRAPCVGSQSLK